jgi:hypothetical protein
MKLANALPTGFAVGLLTLFGLGSLVGLALPLDIDLAVFFATQFSGILVVLVTCYVFAEHIERRSYHS